jgi:hypothetical protein
VSLNPIKETVKMNHHNPSNIPLPTPLWPQFLPSRHLWTQGIHTYFIKHSLKHFLLFICFLLKNRKELICYTLNSQVQWTCM